MPSGLKIFLLIGQSNMKGTADVADLPASGYPYNGSRIWNYKFNGTWVQNPSDPLHDATGSPYRVFTGVGGVGPGLSFADTFARYHPGFSIGLVPCAQGSTSADEWARPADGVDTTTLYGASRARWNAAAASGVISGALVYQGEADTLNSTDALAWAGKWAAIMASIRSDTGVPNLPIVFCELATQGFDPIRPNWNLLMAAQEHAAIYPRTTRVTAKDLTRQVDDEQHIDTASHLILGRRFAHAMRALGACE